MIKFIIAHLIDVVNKNISLDFSVSFIGFPQILFHILFTVRQQYHRNECRTARRSITIDDPIIFDNIITGQRSGTVLYIEKFMIFVFLPETD